MDSLEIETTQFFAPVQTTLLDALIGSYKTERAAIEEVSNIVRGARFAGTIGHFIEGNARESRLPRAIARKSYSVSREPLHRSTPPTGAGRWP